ncbi:DNA polymerase Y family protein [Saccharothrix obliqua]|uniref:DNA polymerase Y family protein n=1 Tax=Saccharothrix obliqua TaxID=2861747 RepID=UPI001C5DBDCD|nr:DNA polymerase Y family protein [Saccharothrix obliqua]MBW4716071.1 DNA polymerase Y family protein [Saccharothrix obliqua]
MASGWPDTGDVVTDPYTLAVWCPDWPVVAAAAEAALLPHLPAAVVRGNEVVACSAVARAEGVRRGQRKRAAQGVCPELVVFEHDDVRDARLFEPVAAAVEELAPGIEVVRPGLVTVAAKGPAGYYGSAEAAAERVVDHVADRAGVEAQVGFADGLFAATIAARRGAVVPPGRTREFLAPLDIRELDPPDERRADRTELVDLLRRLGLRTLGAFAAIPERDVAGRFGKPAVLAHRLASGVVTRPRARRRPPPELSVAEHLDPPVDRVDAAAFAAKALAERLHRGLADRGLACTRLGIRATTEHGGQLRRVWRCADPLTPQGIADRVRWQLDGWLTRERLTAGVELLELDPEEVVDADALQLGLWPGAGQDQGEAAERAARAMVHVQGLLGPDAVVTPVPQGGRGPVERIRLVPWGDDRTPATDPDQPWPGRLPAPSPATVFAPPEPVVLLDETGGDVVVTGYAELVARPHRIVHGGQTRKVVAWAGPWPVDERWWDGEHALRAARLQVLGTTPDGAELGYLLIRANGEWAVEGVYD